MRESEILQQALDLLRRDGWCKYIMRNKHGQHCAAGAVMDVDVIGTESYSWWAALSNTAEELFPERAYIHDGHAVDCYWERPGCPIAHINNHPLTVFEDVEQIFEKSIIRLQEQDR